MKHDWKKTEKNLYIPKAKPELVWVPEYDYIYINGQGDPNTNQFRECVGTLFALSYSIKMSYKKNPISNSVVDYAVYPLEGEWDLNESAKRNFSGQINKNDFVYKLMIRQPDFITQELVEKMIEKMKGNNPNQMLNNIQFGSFKDGECIQMLHKGSFDSENVSFDKMETLIAKMGYSRIGKNHKEIYLSDARRTSPEKLRTVLRFRVMK